MVITALSTIGGLTAYFILWPRLDISEEPHPKEESPIAIPFAVLNNGVLPVYPQELVCVVTILKLKMDRALKTLPSCTNRRVC
jgi:hypothetical protein